MIVIQFWKFTINPLNSYNTKQTQQTAISPFYYLFLYIFVSDVNCLYISKMVKLCSSSSLKLITNAAPGLIISSYGNCLQLCIEKMKYCLYFFLFHNDTHFIWYYISANREMFFRSDVYLKLVGRMLDDFKNKNEYWQHFLNGASTKVTAFGIFMPLSHKKR